jgi:hypothetical protein
MDDLDNLRDLAAAADELGLAPVTLRAAVERGRFRARKFGNAWVTTTQEIERYRRENLGKVGRPKTLSEKTQIFLGNDD